MSRLFVFLCTLFCISQLYANIIDYFDPPIEGDYVSKLYRLGRYLVYDCENRHFVCTDLVSYENCRLRRQTATMRNYEYLNCAPLKEFEGFEECRRENYRLIHSINNLSFCLNSR